MQRTLPTDSTARKRIPPFSGCIAYFAAALAGVARWSVEGNEKHNKGQPLHHARGKSTDHADCIVRHLIDIGDLEAHLARTPAPCGDSACIAALLDEADALSWRALALSQRIHEQYGGAPLAPAAREPSNENEKRIIADMDLTTMSLQFEIHGEPAITFRDTPAHKQEPAKQPATFNDDSFPEPPVATPDPPPESLRAMSERRHTPAPLRPLCNRTLMCGLSNGHAGDCDKSYTGFSG